MIRRVRCCVLCVRVFPPCVSPDIETMPCCRVAPHLPFLMVIRVIAWLPNNVVQLPGNGLRVSNPLSCPRPRNHGQLCVNANAVQTLMPNGTTNTTRLNETYIPHWPKWLSPYTPSFPVSLPSCNAAGDRWPLNAFLNAIIGQPSSTSSGPNSTYKFAALSLQHHQYYYYTMQYRPQEGGKPSYTMEVYAVAAFFDAGPSSRLRRLGSRNPAEPGGDSFIIKKLRASPRLPHRHCPRMSHTFAVGMADALNANASTPVETLLLLPRSTTTAHSITEWHFLVRHLSPNAPSFSSLFASPHPFDPEDVVSNKVVTLRTPTNTPSTARNSSWEGEDESRITFESVSLGFFISISALVRSPFRVPTSCPTTRLCAARF